jgi:hypothetical protein
MLVSHALSNRKKLRTHATATAMQIASEIAAKKLNMGRFI